MSITHVAGSVLNIGPRIIQRCALCGACLTDVDTRKIGVPLDQAGEPYPTWRVGDLVRVGGSHFQTIDYVAGDALPEDSCIESLPTP